MFFASVSFLLLKRHNARSDVRAPTTPGRGGLARDGFESVVGSKSCRGRCRRRGDARSPTRRRPNANSRKKKGEKGEERDPCREGWRRSPARITTHSWMLGAQSSVENEKVIDARRRVDRVNYQVPFSGQNVRGSSIADWIERDDFALAHAPRVWNWHTTA